MYNNIIIYNYIECNCDPLCGENAECTDGDGVVCNVCQCLPGFMGPADLGTDGCEGKPTLT